HPSTKPVIGNSALVVGRVARPLFADCGGRFPNLGTTTRKVNAETAAAPSARRRCARRGRGIDEKRFTRLACQRPSLLRCPEESFARRFRYGSDNKSRQRETFLTSRKAGSAIRFDMCVCAQFCA